MPSKLTKLKVLKFYQQQKFVAETLKSTFVKQAVKGKKTKNETGKKY